ncbi:hypothetical protein [Streptomyces sp. NBC_01171]|uniref:hypothetical protein n=1 Tax=Streptomyces sp. NBC_01171 TaxID=2903757 RepID=UPI00386E226E|nr:hypothetical protein OG448_20935 [Streptomyces sp. NBC_01171]
MTKRWGLGPWLRHRPLSVRLLAVLAYFFAVAGLAALCFHWVMGKPWDDSLSFALTVTTSGLGVLCGAAIIRWKDRRDNH